MEIFFLIIVLVCGFYLIDFNINKNINRLIRALSFSFNDMYITTDLSSINAGLNNIDSSINDVKEGLQAITMELSDISSQLTTLTLTR